MCLHRSQVFQLRHRFPSTPAGVNSCRKLNAGSPSAFPLSKGSAPSAQPVGGTQVRPDLFPAGRLKELHPACDVTSPAFPEVIPGKMAASMHHAVQAAITALQQLAIRLEEQSLHPLPATDTVQTHQRCVSSVHRAITPLLISHHDLGDLASAPAPDSPGHFSVRTDDTDPAYTFTDLSEPSDLEGPPTGYTTVGPRSYTVPAVSEPQWFFGDEPSVQRQVATLPPLPRQPALQQIKHHSATEIVSAAVEKGARVPEDPATTADVEREFIRRLETPRLGERPLQRYRATVLRFSDQRGCGLLQDSYSGETVAVSRRAVKRTYLPKREHNLHVGEIVEYTPYYKGPDKWAAAITRPNNPKQRPFLPSPTTDLDESWEDYYMRRWSEVTAVQLPHIPENWESEVPVEPKGLESLPASPPCPSSPSAPAAKAASSASPVPKSSRRKLSRPHWRP